MNLYYGGVTDGALEGYLELKSSGPMTTSCQAHTLLVANNLILSPSVAGFREA